jgi:hypothetical protein
VKTTKEKKGGKRRGGKSNDLKGKKARSAERAAKAAARKGDGSFPDILVVTKEKSETSGKKYFAAHNGDGMETLYKDGETVAVYKLHRVSTMSIVRKVVR